jgi:hypothetical protein
MAEQVKFEAILAQWDTTSLALHIDFLLLANSTDQNYSSLSSGVAHED